jgi:hypothetical protein
VFSDVEQPEGLYLRRSGSRGERDLSFGFMLVWVMCVGQRGQMLQQCAQAVEGLPSWRA